MSTNTAKAEAFIKDVLSMPEDEHKVFTPFALCNEVLDKIPSLDGNILVVANLEFVYTILLQGVDRERVFFATPNDTKARAAEQMQIGGVYKYNNVITKEDVRNMKFDVVVGNPPYQDGNEAKGGARTLWRLFVKHAHDDLITNGGYIAFITPHVSHNARDIGRVFTSSQTLVILPDVSSHFVGVGTRAAAWIVQKVPYKIPTNFPEYNLSLDIRTINTRSLPDVHSLSILNKVNIGQPKIDVKSDRTYSSNWKNNLEKKHIYNTTETKQRKYRIRHAAKDYFCYGTICPSDYTNLKVAWTLSGNPKFAVFEDPIGTCYQMSCYVLVNSVDEGNNLISLYQSKLYQFILKSVRRGGMMTAEEYRLPNFDLTRSWTDNELYQHFNLTNEEIELIESTIK